MTPRVHGSVELRREAGSMGAGPVAWGSQAGVIPCTGRRDAAAAGMMLLPGRCRSPGEHRPARLRSASPHPPGAARGSVQRPAGQPVAWRRWWPQTPVVATFAGPGMSSRPQPAVGGARCCRARRPGAPAGPNFNVQEFAAPCARLRAACMDPVVRRWQCGGSRAQQKWVGRQRRRSRRRRRPRSRRRRSTSATLRSTLHRSPYRVDPRDRPNSRPRVGCAPFVRAAEAVGAFGVQVLASEQGWTTRQSLKVAPG